MYNDEWVCELEKKLSDYWQKVEASVEEAKAMLDSASLATLGKKVGSFHLYAGDTGGCDELCDMNSRYCRSHEVPCDIQKINLVSLESKYATVAVAIEIDMKDFFEGRIALPLDDGILLKVPLPLFFQYRDLVESLCVRLSLRNWLLKHQAKLGSTSIANMLNRETKYLLKSMPYKEYLQTDHWKKTREAAYKSAENRCQVCNAANRPLHAHHRTYVNRGDEKSTDLIVLCEDCHKLFHQQGKISK